MIRALLGAILLLLAAPAQAAPRWVTGWATAPMAMEGEHALAPGAVTIRQTVRLSIAGSAVRLRVTNRHGSAPLTLAGLTVGTAAVSGATDDVRGSTRRVTFAGADAVTVPAGSDYWSDPVPFAVSAGTMLGISLRATLLSGGATGHPGARATSHVSRGTAAAEAATRWYFLSAIDVAADAGGTIAVLGDSITDGYGVRTDSDGRWTDYLSQRLQAAPATRHLAVANLGIGGNRLLLDGLGPNALARLDRDVLGLSGLRHLVVLIGVNDLGTLTRDAPVPAAEHRALVARMIAGYAQIAARARAAGVRVIGATILPYGGSGYYHPDAANEADRQEVNAWIRAPGSFDAVLDLDAAMRDPARPERLMATFDNDGLHPSDAGYRAMADAVPLALFAPAAAEVVLTFDDLPMHGPLPKGVTAAAVARDIVATLKRHRVGEAYGFVNAGQAAQDRALEEPLRLWRAGGFPLANHGWSHANLDTLDAARFAEEVAQGEAPLRAAMPAGGWRYFRYPYLAEGRDAGARAAARRVLADRGYAVAPVSLDFSDWRFNTIYARCADTRDAAAVARLEVAFLDAARVSLRDARAASAARYGREIPLVLLLHSGAFTARLLPRLLDLYTAQGMRFGRLGDALADPAYAVARTSASEGESDPLAPRAVPDPDIDGLCR